MSWCLFGTCLTAYSRLPVNIVFSVIIHLSLMNKCNNNNASAIFAQHIYLVFPPIQLNLYRSHISVLYYPICFFCNHLWLFPLSFHQVTSPYKFFQCYELYDPSMGRSGGDDSAKILFEQDNTVQHITQTHIKLQASANNIILFSFNDIFHFVFYLYIALYSNQYIVYP